MKKGLLMVTLILFISLVGCQNNNLKFSDEIISVDVYEWDDESLVNTIEDKDWIDELVEQLNTDRTHSTADMDYPLPDYKLIFKNDQNKEVFRIGYYIEVVKLGVKGRYLDVEKDIMYKVELPCP